MKLKNITYLLILGLLLSCNDADRHETVNGGYGIGEKAGDERIGDWTFYRDDASKVSTGAFVHDLEEGNWLFLSLIHI